MPTPSGPGISPIDLDAVHRWGVAAGLPDAPIRDVRRIGGGID